jgi:hypothetical protein
MVRARRLRRQHLCAWPQYGYCGLKAVDRLVDRSIWRHAEECMPPHSHPAYRPPRRSINVAFRYCPRRSHFVHASRPGEIEGARMDRTRADAKGLQTKQLPHAARAAAKLFETKETGVLGFRDWRLIS